MTNCVYVRAVEGMVQEQTKYGPKPRPVLARFLEKADTSGECWVWTGCTNSSGYGRLKVGGKHMQAHRLSWAFFRGPIPAGLCVLHKCDNPPCVNPDHLFLGTHQDNVRDRDAKGRQAPQAGESNGNAQLTAANVRHIRELRASGLLLREIHKEFPRVSYSALCHAATGRTWKHL